MKKSMLRNGLILALFALVCTALVAVVNHLTADKIVAQEKLELGRVLHQIIPDKIHDNQLTDYCTLVHAPKALGTDNPLPAYVATKDGKPVAIAMESIAPDGYSGDIKMIVAINNAGVVLGVRTLYQQETPGLGDKIDIRKSNWVESFVGKFITPENEQEWHVKKDGGEFDQFTGATITPRAYVKAVKKTLLYFNANKDSIYKQPINCEIN